MLSDKEIINGIANNNSSIIQHIYDELYPYIEAYVVHHNGTKDQAPDIFQEGMIVLLNKISSGKFTLSCKLSTYIYAVCKRIWIQERKKYAIRLIKMQEMSLAAEPAVQYGDDTINKANDLYEKHFKQMSPDCQKLLRLYFNGLNSKEIMEIMEISSIHNTSDKKFRCKKRLMDRITEDPLFKKLQ